MSDELFKTCDEDNCKKASLYYHFTNDMDCYMFCLEHWIKHEPEVVTALLATLREGVEGLRQNSHIHHGSYVQGHNHAIDKVLALITELEKAGDEG